jgi:hypothetical protein
VPCLGQRTNRCVAPNSAPLPPASWQSLCGAAPLPPASRSPCRVDSTCTQQPKPPHTCAVRPSPSGPGSTRRSQAASSPPASRLSFHRPATVQPCRSSAFPVARTTERSPDSGLRLVGDAARPEPPKQLRSRSRCRLAEARRSEPPESPVTEMTSDSVHRVLHPKAPAAAPA